MAPASPLRRGAVALSGAALATTATWLLYPKLFAGPMVDVPVRVRELWLPQISEMMPIVGQASLGQSGYLLLLYLGAALPASAYMIWLVRRSTGAERGLWLLLLLATLLYVGLGMLQLRWGIYAQIAALPAYGKLLHTVLRWLGLDMAAGGERRRRIGGILAATFARLAVLSAFALGFPAAALLAKPGGGAAMSVTDGAPAQACDVTAVGRALGGDGELGRQPRRILTYIFDGPELLYRTPHAVVATPYHRNSAGILDTYDLFAATDIGTARGIVRARGVDWVLLCPGGSEALLYRRAGETTLLDRLRRGEVPDWLVPLEAPLALPGEWALFQVRD